MYEQVSHSALNHILDELKPDVDKQTARDFYSRLGANFYAIYSLFNRLYGSRDDFHNQLTALASVLIEQYKKRNHELRLKDKERERNHDWFLSQRWVGMALYANGFSDNLAGVLDRIDYFDELGVNLVHILPILKCPQGKSDGGYAVSDFRRVDDRLGSNELLEKIIGSLHENESLIALDIVVNHTSDEHAWAKMAMAGDKKYQDYFYTFDSRAIPDMFEQSMLEVFPETDPGNFTWNEAMQKWVMTVFHKYQWDLNYSNPEVFIAMLDIILYWSNKGVDILRLDAVAFLWKKIGSVSQNEHEAHLILQLFKDCCQVVCPGLLFIAEAIVAPSEVIKYFGEDAVVAKECEIAYNATYMALLWDAVATKNSRLLCQGLQSLPDKIEGATWLNYLRCHDDIGFGFENSDIAAVGYNPHDHRKFLLEYYTGNFTSSYARGKPFGYNEKTGDARVSGSLASLVGLEYALESGDQELITQCCNHIVLLHSLIMSFGGIPLLYYGDEMATLNDYSYFEDETKFGDSRWLHRPKIDWNIAESRKIEGSVQKVVFESIQKLIALRKSIDAFADNNNRRLINFKNDSLFSFIRYNPASPASSVAVIVNFSADPQALPVADLFNELHISSHLWWDLWADKPPVIFSENIVLSGFQFYWISSVHG